MFSDKEQIWADNAESSPYFGNVYVCNVGFRGNGRAREPVLLARSTDGGDTWTTRQLTAATNNARPAVARGAPSAPTAGAGLRALRDFDKQRGTGVIAQVRSTDGGHVRPPASGRGHRRHRSARPGPGPVHHRRRRRCADQHLPEPGHRERRAQRRGRHRPDRADLVRRPRGHEPGAGVPAHVHRSRAVVPRRGRQESHRANQPAVAISPDGRRGLPRLQRYLRPWQSTTARNRPMLGVVRQANVDPATCGRGVATPCTGARPATRAVQCERSGSRSSSVTTTTPSRPGRPAMRCGTTCERGRLPGDRRVPAGPGRRRHLGRRPAVRPGRRPGRPGGCCRGPDAAGRSSGPEWECPANFGNSSIWGGTFTPVP